MLRRLDTRIVALFLALLLIVQLASFAVIRHGIDRNARAAVAAELSSGEKLLRRLLEQQSENLTQAARLLASDYGFRAAVSSGDRETLSDALANQAQRISATVAIFTDAKFELQAATTEEASHFVPLVRAQANPKRATEAARIVLIDGRPQLLVSVPVKAPLLIGWVAMGFPLGRAVLDDLRELSELPAAILVRSGNEPWQVVDTVLAASVATELDGLLASAPMAETADALLVRPRLAGSDYGARFVEVVSSDQQRAGVVLLRSIDEAVAPYRRLQLMVIALTLVGAVLFAVGSWVMARRVTRPILALSRSAERLGAGDYETPIEASGTEEVTELARAIDTMRVDIRQRDQRITRLAYWDALTGLPNRVAFRERLATLLQSPEPLSVLMLDLDRFKHVNDVLGHGFGDRLLRQIAERLHEVTVGRDRVVIGRLGGDEFAVLLPGADALAGERLARGILESLERPITLDDQTVDVGAGIGLVCNIEHGDDADVLLSRAEVAMYAAKQRQAGVVAYDSTLDSASAQSLSLLGELRRAVETSELRLYLQPKVELGTGLVVGAEALVRWQHPQRGMVPPMQFIPFAEQTGYIRVLTQWVIEETARIWSLLNANGLSLKLAINLSTRDLLDQDLPVKIERVLTRHALPPGALCLEITESAIMDDPQRAQQTLNRLHDMGLSLSIDDFGTGYSSLAYLKRLPVDQLKIDRSFTMNMEHDVADAKIVRSTIDLAHNLGLRVVAEGVETLTAYDLLRAGQCDEAQGYLIARPMPASEFQRWLAGWKAPVLPGTPAEGEAAGAQATAAPVAGSPAAGASPASQETTPAVTESAAAGG